jgi:ATP-dependent RNA helicase DDX23/PRP28
VVLNQCNYLVLDEADRMRDMGFESQVQSILESMPADTLKPEDENFVAEEGKIYRETFMFSATMPPAVERLARKYMRSPAIVNIGEVGKAVDRVEQRVLWITSENAKRDELSKLLNSFKAPIIVFTNEKKQVDGLVRQVEKLGFRTTSLHGGKPQAMREENLQKFKDGVVDVLVATDVAGRGLDVEGVNLVVNYTLPHFIDPYVHRIGRTGRAGKTGTAVSFCMPNDVDIMYDLKKMLAASKAHIPPEMNKAEAANTKRGNTAINNRGLDF